MKYDILSFIKGDVIMKYRKLGNTGLTVSEIGLGAEWLEKRDRSEVESSDLMLRGKRDQYS